MTEPIRSDSAPEPGAGYRAPEPGAGQITPGAPGLEVTIPSGLVDAVLHLVSTGPVPLGGYTLAEMVAVDAVVDFLDEAPSEEVIEEAVRSLAARQLLVSLPDGDRLQVRGDLGIALVFQQRARLVLDARVTGTLPGQPWRTLLLPQPEGVTLEVLITALGVHELALRETEDALRRLRERLPSGDPGPADAVAEQVLTTAPRRALMTVTRYRAEGTAEEAELSTDVVVAEQDGHLHVFVRDPGDPDRLVAQSLGPEEILELIRTLIAVAPISGADGSPDRTGGAADLDSPTRPGVIAGRGRQMAVQQWRRLRQFGAGQSRAAQSYLGQSHLGQSHLGQSGLGLSRRLRRSPLPDGDPEQTNP